jgi:farnesyl diphosphate synthase
MGLENAKSYAQQLHDQAFQALEYFGDNAKELNQISQFLLSRKS